MQLFPQDRFTNSCWHEKLFLIPASGFAGKSRCGNFFGACKLFRACRTDGIKGNHLHYVKALGASHYIKELTSLNQMLNRPDKRAGPSNHLLLHAFSMPSARERWSSYKKKKLY